MNTEKPSNTHCEQTHHEEIDKNAWIRVITGHSNKSRP